MKPLRIISLVIGSLLALVGFELLAGGGVLGWAQATQRDGDGFFTTSTERFETSSYALTSAKVDLGDPYPPFHLDQGPTEPVAPHAPIAPVTPAAAVAATSPV